MSRQKPIQIKIKDNIEVLPEGIYNSTVVKSGNGAVIKFYKKFIGQEVIIMVVNKMAKKKEKLNKEDYRDLVDKSDVDYLCG
jgi:putative transposon-encoded protein